MASPQDAPAASSATPSPSPVFSADQRQAAANGSCRKFPPATAPNSIFAAGCNPSVADALASELTVAGKLSVVQSMVDDLASGRLKLVGDELPDAAKAKTVAAAPAGDANAGAGADDHQLLEGFPGMSANSGQVSLSGSPENLGGPAANFFEFFGGVALCCKRYLAVTGWDKGKALERMRATQSGYHHIGEAGTGTLAKVVERAMAGGGGGASAEAAAEKDGGVGSGAPSRARAAVATPYDVVNLSRPTSSLPHKNAAPTSAAQLPRVSSVLDEMMAKGVFPVVSNYNPAAWEGHSDSSLLPLRARDGSPVEFWKLSKMDLNRMYSLYTEAQIEESYVDYVLRKEALCRLAGAQSIVALVDAGEMAFTTVVSQTASTLRYISAVGTQGERHFPDSVWRCVCYNAPSFASFGWDLVAKTGVLIAATQAKIRVVSGDGAAEIVGGRWEGGGERAWCGVDEAVLRRCRELAVFRE